MTEVIDESPRAPKRGVFAIQLNSSAPTDVMVKDIRVKAAGAAAAAVGRRPGAAAVAAATQPAARVAAAPAPATPAVPPGRRAAPRRAPPTPPRRRRGSSACSTARPSAGGGAWPTSGASATARSPARPSRAATRGVDTYLVWNGPEFKDFELRFKFKINGGNSGMTFRATLLDKGGYRVGGYSADIDDTGEPLDGPANMTDEAGTLGPRSPSQRKGQKVTFTPKAASGSSGSGPTRRDPPGHQGRRLERVRRHRRGQPHHALHQRDR